jgi:hypothetical protein
MKDGIRRPAEGTRRGVILLVVLALLTLFAVIGICFVLYAQTAAQASRLYRDAERPGRPDVAPEMLLTYFLGQLIYDLPDDATGVYSGLRGHSLARTMYGVNDTAPNVVPFNGTGRLHYDSALKGLGLADLPAVVLDDYHLINYTFFRDDAQFPPEQRVLRDPERLGPRPGLEAPRGHFTGGANAPYTYPDLNSLFLAAVKADGTVLMPSFHRPWLFGPADRANDNWRNMAGKYLLIRPRPVDQKRDPDDPTEPELFPYPEDEGGDAKNLIGAPGGNDSFWIDLDFPVLTAPDGRRYKPLFAPLITDLDNRVNVNVHGNVRGLNAGHASNQGWGPWEVNVNWVLNKRDEWRQLLVGDGRQPGGNGRYGRDQVPSSPPANIAPFRAAHFYGQVDADGYNYDQAPYGASGPLQLPGFGAAPFQCFPNYPPGYGNGSAAECTNHPLLYNLFQPAGDDRVFAASNLEALLRYGDTGSAGLTSELFRLCPENFGDPADPSSAARRRNLVTTHSFDLDRPGMTPWIWDASAASSQYRLTAGHTYPGGSAVAFPSLSLRSTALVSAQSDFQMPGQPPDSPLVDWRALGAALGRVDLNRPLPDYPAPDPVSAQIRTEDLPAFRRAEDARVQLARDIFERLRLVTGAAPPAQVPAGSPQFNALRWLAQLAVNIVDYIDTDDYMTPFPWYTDAGGNVHTVYGTELPRVVLNEAYVEISNDPHDPGLRRRPKQPDQHRRAHRDFVVNFWVELLNPFRRDATLADNGAARLQAPGGYAVYQVVVARTPNLGLHAPANVRGDPDPGRTIRVVNRYTPDPSGPPPDPATDVLRIEPLDGRPAGAVGQNQGFYVLGPAVDFPGTPPHTPFATLRIEEQVSDGFVSGLSYRVPNTAPLSLLPAHALFLRRLACPHLPPNPAPGGLFNPALPQNPYITVDTMTPVPMNDGVLVDAEGSHVPTPVARRAAFGRPQPYAATPLQLTPQRPATVAPGQPRHTFFRHNQPRKFPFDWLVHLDRPLISSMELLQVSAFKPHQLTHRFQTPGQPFDHRVPWTRPELRLYRVFEFLQTHNRAEGLSPAPGGRTAGKINVNTIWDPETFLALCDPQPGNVFQVQDLYRPLGQGSGYDDPDQPETVYWRLMLSRTPTCLTGGGPGPKDRPFQSLAAGHRPPWDSQFPAGGINDTLLRADPVEPGKRLFELDPEGPGTAHPYLRDQLLAKIFNHLTTRSHVFAVWVTVGFFEVTDESTRPVKLGAELGRAENRHVRHRLFAIVDRSQLTLSGDAGFVMNAMTAVPKAPADATVAVPVLSGTSEGLSWDIRPGCRLVVDVGAAQEVVTVTAVSPPDAAPAFQASFTKPHPAGFAVTNLGNPGPQPGFNPRQQPGVVRYFSIID